MTLVVDTSILIDQLRGNLGARDAMLHAARDGERVAASVLTKVEVLAGMRASETAITRRLLDTIDWIEVGDDLAERAGALANRYLRSHPGIDPVDFVIAATAEHLAAELWTLNIRHFPMFPNLHPPY